MTCAAILGAVAWLVATGSALAANDRLTVTQDESSMERVIESYLKKVYSLPIVEKTNGADDMYLDLSVKGDPMPGYGITVDTQPLRKGNDGEVLERGVAIVLQTGIKVPAEKQPAILKIINDCNRTKLFSAAYVDTDAEIVFTWMLDVTAEGLPTGDVYLVMDRQMTLWQGLWPLVSPALH